MRSTKREQGTLILTMVFGLAAGVCSAQAPATPAAATAPATESQPAPAAIVAAPPEAPVTPPKVVCAGGQIAISANNSTLSSVLAEVHRCLGARIDIPEAAGAKHLYDKIGPGPAAQVLGELLSNIGYNYIIGASPDNDEKIESIVLLDRTGDTTVAASVDDSRTGSTSRRAFMQMHQASIPHPMTEADSAAAAEIVKPKEAAPTAPADDAAAPAPAAPVPADGQQPPAAPAPDATPKPADAAPPQPDAPATPASSNNTYTSKPQTTEEQIVNMQQMFELRKQMNQQQQQQQAAPPQN